MHKQFRFAGRSSLEFGIYISGQKSFKAPEKDYEEIEVPGKNGTLILSKGRYKNVTIPYPAFIRENFAENAQNAKEWLFGAEGYQRLEDDYNPDVFRLAYFAGPIDFSMRFLNKSGEMTLSFNCKPQKYLKSGEQAIEVTNGGVVTNNWKPAMPLITVYGDSAGVLKVGDISVQIKSLTDQITLDCEVLNAYRQVGEGAPENKNLTIYAPEFPVLPTGDTVITWTGGITKVEIIPRWWTL